MLGRSQDDILILCTDAGHHASMMILYLGKQVNEELKLEFVFSIGNLDNESGNIPRNELDIMERGTKQCEKIIEWMSPQVKKKILIADAKVPLLWLRNKELCTQPYVQTRIHSICKTFEADKFYHIKSKENPADLGTKFEFFNQTYQMLDDDSLFRNGPECLKMGIRAAVTSKRLIPIDKISLSKVERDMAALEVMKLHQLVITENKNENFMTEMNSSDSIDEETIEDTVACLLVSDNDAVEKESWMNQKTTGYRAKRQRKQSEQR